MENPVGVTKLGQTMEDLDIRHLTSQGNMVQYNFLSACNMSRIFLSIF